MLKGFNVTLIPESTEPLTKSYPGFFQSNGRSVTARDLRDAQGIVSFLGKSTSEINFAEMGVTRTKQNPSGPPWSREMWYEHGDAACSFFFDEKDRTTIVLVLPNPRKQSCQSCQISEGKN